MTDLPAALVQTPDIQVRLAPHKALGVLRLGADAGAEALTRIEVALNCALPRAPNTASGQRPRALWTAPREWVLIDASTAQLDALQAACTGLVSHYANVTDGWIGLHITGQDAPRVIASECPLDLSPAALPDDHCVASVFAGVPILVDRRTGENGLRLYVDVSLAEHLVSWLKAAAEAGWRPQELVARSPDDHGH